MVSSNELGGNMLEVTMRKQNIIQRSPITIGCAVLFISKAIMMRFYSDFILKHINKRYVAPIYCDTGIVLPDFQDQLPDFHVADCWKLALAAESLEKCVAPSQMDSFLADSREFLVDETSKETIAATKVPGKFAVESRADIAICLNPKSYFESLLDHEYPTKLSTKGISKRQNLRQLTRQSFTEALFGEGPKKIVNTGFLRKQSEMCTYRMIKNGLHAGFYKRFTHDCFVHTTVYDWL